ncbi:LacI family DNA-binding transcriptional regulator [Variovorax sp. J22R133]|uniref:LacI family DNA-binding transcriptional regulator n=1 Tax=Variovorax brevis TaxID=3053503 RepID=UPI00257818E1|nr:LacI family DNA-binding transcriptional regulator [Variovorax sp. J22R133]MDM0111358.1 LacI family DNA-binding transcriptional regulator [Variovorax sp. J22R133]
MTDSLQIRRPTIGAVAAKAGVSKATVSRFFNHEKLLSPDIAARVKQAITSLGYAPSPMAQALSRGRSRLIGLIVADITNPFSVAVLRGAEKACQEAGYLVMLFNLGNASGREREAIDVLAGYQVDGFILNTLGRGAEVVDAIKHHGKPAVLVDRRHSGMVTDFVALDSATAMATACKHLVDCDYRELLYVTEPKKGVSSRQERAAAFTKCVSSHGQRVAGQVFECSEDSGAALEEAVRSLMLRAREARDGRRSAVVSGNAVVTLRVASVIARCGWRFGDDVGFLGFDDPEWAHLIGPGLSAIAQPTESIGRAAANCLIDRLRGADGPPQQILLPGQLVVRGSTDVGQRAGVVASAAG